MNKAFICNISFPVRKIVLPLLFLTSSFHVFSQEDSLKNALQDATNKQKTTIYRQLTDLTLYEANDKAVNYALNAVKFAELTGDKWSKAYSLRLLGIYYDIHGDYKKAIENINEAWRINKEIEDDGGISACLSSLGIIYFNQGKYDKALEFFLAVIDYYDDDKAAYNKSLTISNIAAIYKYQEDYNNAIKYYRQAYQLMKKTGSEKGLGISANNLGMAFYSTKDIDSALFYLKKGLELKRKVGDKRSLTYSLSNISQVYDHIGEYKKASDLLEECMQIQLEMGDKKGYATSQVALGDLLESQKGNDKDILKNYTEALATAKEIGDLYLCQLASNKAALKYYAAGDFKEAANYMYEYTIYKDSLYSTEKAKSFAEMQTKFDTERKEKEIALLNQKNAQKELQITIANNEKLKREQTIELLNKEGALNEAKLQKANADREAEIRQNEILKKDKLLQAERLNKEKAEKEKLNEQNKKKEQQIYAFAIGSVLLIGLLFFVVRGYRQKKKANALLEEQNIEINKQKEEIVFQSAIIEEKNRDVMSSITYAKRLQDAILPSSQEWNSILPDSFILYLPKDIIAGDFYFIEKINDLIIVAAADCTGHGVPGAMVSVVCSNALTRSVKEFGLTDPGKILDKVREMIIDTFKHSDSEVRDGMDISLAVVDRKNNSMKWSGANNPLLIVRKEMGADTVAIGRKVNEGYLLEFTADKQPVGFSEIVKPFTTNEVVLVPGDIIYLFTDGYSDQFGGEKGKKFKYSNLKKLLTEYKEMELPQIKSKLLNNFENWRGDLEQVDDVCVIGIRT